MWETSLSGTQLHSWKCLGKVDGQSSKSLSPIQLIFLTGKALWLLSHELGQDPHHPKKVKILIAGQQWRHRHREQKTYGHSGGWWGEGGRYGESNMETYITICKTDSQWEFAVWLRELKQGLCNNLGGREMGGRFKMEGTYVYLWLIHVDVWQKSTQFCKAIILQLKNK